MVLERRGSGRLVTVYGAAHLGKSLFWYSGEVLFAYFLTEVAGLSPLNMGFVLASGLLVSAAIDLLVGVTFGKSLSRAATAAQLQLTGAMLSGVALMLFFLTPFVQTDLRLMAAVAASVFLRLCYGIYDVSQNALLTLATTNELQRVRLAAVRIWCSGLATLTVALALGPLVASTQADQGQFAFLLFAASTALFGVLSSFALRRQVVLSPQPTASTPFSVSEPQNMQVHSTVVAIGSLLLIHFLLTGPASTFAKLEPYFTAYVLQSASWGSAVIAAFALGAIMSQAGWAALGAHWGRTKMFQTTGYATIASAAAFWAIGANSAPLALVAAFALGLSHSGLSMTLWAAFAQTVAARASSATGFAYGAFTASAKLSLAMASMAIGVGLSGVDFRDEGRSFITAAMSIGPIFGTATAILVVLITRGRRSAMN